MPRNDENTPQSFVISNYVCDNTSSVVITLTGTVAVGANAGASLTQTASVPTPGLWSPENPSLYDVYTEVKVNGKVTDVTSEQTGFRYYDLSDKDFKLNGVSTLLRGANFHMENEKKGRLSTKWITTPVGTW